MLAKNGKKCSRVKKGICSLRTISVDARVKYPLYLLEVKKYRLKTIMLKTTNNTEDNFV